MWGALLDYYHYTKDPTYNTITTQALLSQVGPDYDYMVALHAKDEGNDDQAFWGFATMTASEIEYSSPPDPIPTWFDLTQNLWNTQAARWDMSTCGGGLRWQIFTFNNGYNYKNSVSNGAFFQLAARLGRYSGNQTYFDWVEKVWDWSTGVGLLDPQTYAVYDGTDDTMNCTSLDHIQWTYSLGIYLYGAAVMYNYTNGSSLWQQRTEGLLNASAVFFSPFANASDIMYEAACETAETCNTDQFSFKGYLSRFMYKTAQLAPFTADAIMSLLPVSAKAAAGSCSGGVNEETCGTKWYVGGWDGTFGVGQQLSALETIQGLLVDEADPPIVGSDVHLMAASNVSAAPIPSATGSIAPNKNGATARGVGALDAAMLVGGLAVNMVLG
jgi:mannan endo-1,6-alpha-mannosidase